ncbi:NECAP CG9132 [Olea europaea subsp. europaea]|uniref:NECAP CG9132 n=1 Tax=Olea europaea subsp. europaea TaxID=158383 RepID=A0A8S0V3M8_OLEEU|nr:NECAP CG9132 [Olea europaea subsp. europaea]
MWISICHCSIPPRKTAASYRADDWNVNKWEWEGTLKVISKGEECIIRLEDKKTGGFFGNRYKLMFHNLSKCSLLMTNNMSKIGELYARAFLREGEPHPVEPVIDSSRYFVLRVEENIGGRLRHAFIGIGFRERPEAYDFQAALHDHMKYFTNPPYFYLNSFNFEFCFKFRSLIFSELYILSSLVLGGWVRV